MDFSTLAELGLKDAEIRVYTALLESGPTSIRGVAAAAKVNRGTTYEALKRLSETGLVAYTRHGERNKYRAESPERIFDLIDEKRRTLVIGLVVSTLISGLGGGLPTDFSDRSACSGRFDRSNASSTHLQSAPYG